MKDIGKKGGENVMSKKEWGKPGVRELDVLMTEEMWSYKDWLAELNKLVDSNPAKGVIDTWLLNNQHS